MISLKIAGREDDDEVLDERARLRADIARKIALGGGWSVGAVVVMGAFDVIRSDPHEAFPFLLSWGPKAVGAIVLLYVVYDLVRMGMRMLDRLIHAVEKLAVAQQKSADKDDRQVQEMQTLTSYTAQQSEKIYTKQNELAETQAEMIGMLATLQRNAPQSKGSN